MADPINLAPHTTQDDLNAIQAHYGDNYAAVDQAILTGVTGPFQVEDLIDYRVRFSGELPDALVQAMEGSLPNPESKAWLWEENEVATYQFWRNTEAANDGPLHQLLAFIEANNLASVDTDTSGSPAQGSVLDEIRDRISQWNENEMDPDVEGKDRLDESLNLFHVGDLKEMMSLLLDMGNPGMALMFYFAWGLNPAIRDVEEEAMAIYEDAISEMEELADNAASAMELDSPEGQAEAQRLNQQLGVINTVVQLMSQFMQQLNSMKNEILQMASDLAASDSRTKSAVIGNIGR